jgi:excisionase family DNA binding protein
MFTDKVSQELPDSSTTVQQNGHQGSLPESQYLLTAKARSISLSEKEYGVLLDMLIALRQGRLVTFIADDTEMTTQQAADILNVSRSYFVTLLENGAIPFTQVGDDCKVLAKDVLFYKEKRDVERRQALQEFSASIYEDGLDDLDYETVQKILNDD